MCLLVQFFHLCFSKLLCNLTLYIKEFHAGLILIRCETCISMINRPSSWKWTRYIMRKSELCMERRSVSLASLPLMALIQRQDISRNDWKWMFRGQRSVNLVPIYTSLVDNSIILLTGRERNLDNCGVTLTLIHWLGPLFYYHSETYPSNMD